MFVLVKIFQSKCQTSTTKIWVEKKRKKKEKIKKKKAIVYSSLGRCMFCF